MRRRRSITVLGLALFVAAALSDGPAFTGGTGAVGGSVVTGGKRRAGVVVSVDGDEGAGAATGTPRIRQRDTQFDPSLTVVTVGTTIEFPNEDKIFHNVFSLSEPAKFDLGLYKSGSSKSVTFRKPGVVDVYCNIHPQMVAKIKVMENDRWAITKADGTFKLTGVSPGRHVVTAWQPNGEARSTEIVVAAGQTAELQLDLPEPRPGHAHTRKDGTPYGRYK